MDNQISKQRKKNICVGLLAHVDAGKTTLSEALLYEAGVLKKPGRVDNQDSFLDTDSQERERGITIFSKQAVFSYGENVNITIVDTPGHVDFSAEMERTLWTLDYAILVVSGTEKVQGHTKTLWKLLEQYQIPVFLFVNKMDRVDTDSTVLMENIKKQLDTSCVDFSEGETDAFYEAVAMCDEDLLERYFDLPEENFEAARKELFSSKILARLIHQRKVVPCFFGSALKLQGIDSFLKRIVSVMEWGTPDKGGDDFGARVFKISRDMQGNRLTHMKITGGRLKVKDVLEEEKVNQIRIYSGNGFDVVLEAEPGMVCAVTGMNHSYPGQGLGIEQDAGLPVLEPVLTYTLELPDDVDGIQMLPKLRQLEEEEPELKVEWQEETHSIQMKIMGQVQIEVLQKLIEKRYGVEVRFGTGRIIYKETIENCVEGVGHFEPLKHYAEVHLLLEPAKRGSGLQFETDCREEVLDKNWKRLILTHLKEREHLGVLMGAAITDMKITLVSGKAHTKHTEGGDFRQATYRAVRQGLMQAKSILLEPYYSFRLEIPSDCIGRAMTDVENMSGRCEAPVIDGDEAVLTGVAPVSTMGDYQTIVHSYTRGRGVLFCSLKGFERCHNEEEVLQEASYNAQGDLEHPADSVFCSHGAGVVVPWNQVFEYMHLDCILTQKKDMEEEEITEIERRKNALFDDTIDEEQIAAILNRTYHNNERAGKHYKKKKAPALDLAYRSRVAPVKKERYLIVDGYNIVHAWEELNCLVEDDNLDGARAKLLDILCNYQGYVRQEIIVVFDGYRVKGNLGEMYDYQNIHVVYTKEAETADSYIEKLTHKISKDYAVTVATSDGLIQLITRGQNCMVLSARELKADIERVEDEIRTYLS